MLLRFTVPELLSMRTAAEPHKTALVVERVGSITFGEKSGASAGDFGEPRELVSAGEAE